MAEATWEAHRALAADAMVSSAIRELLKVTEQEGMISFAGGLPSPDCFPTAAIAEATQNVLARSAGKALQYGPTPGLMPLRELCAEMLVGRGISVGGEQVLITSGSQQALDVIGKLMIDPGDTVLVEDPTYLGALQAWRPYRPTFATLPMDDEGLIVDALVERLADLRAAGTSPKFLYVVPNFQNPTGVSMSAARRHVLLDVAAEHDLPILEDDPYGELRYTGETIPPLAALDVARHGEPRHVVYLSTFSKLLAPGLRVGWVTAPAWMLRRIEQVKEGLDLHTGTLSQAIAYEACRDGLLERHIPVIRKVYGERREVMLGALADEMPAGVHWTTPEGGMFLWCNLPPGVSSAAVFDRAIAQHVAFVPGSPFFANGGGEGAMRLNFSHPDPDQLRTGVARLAAAIR